MNNTDLVACGKCVHIMPSWGESSHPRCDLLPLTEFDCIRGTENVYNHDICFRKNERGNCPDFQAGQSPHTSTWWKRLSPQR